MINCLDYKHILFTEKEKKYYSKPHRCKDCKQKKIIDYFFKLCDSCRRKAIKELLEEIEK